MGFKLEEFIFLVLEDTLNGLRTAVLVTTSWQV